MWQPLFFLYVNNIYKFSELHQFRHQSMDTIFPNLHLENGCHLFSFLIQKYSGIN